MLEIRERSKYFLPEVTIRQIFMFENLKKKKKGKIPSTNLKANGDLVQKKSSKGKTLDPGSHKYPALNSFLLRISGGSLGKGPADNRWRVC